LIEDKLVWDRFIDSCPDAYLFHKWDFLKIMEKHTDFKLFPYGVYKGEEIICLCPIFFKKYKGFKRVYSPPPQTMLYVPYLGPIMVKRYNGMKQRKKEDYLNMAIDEINEEINKIAPDYISISTTPRFYDIRPFKWNGFDADIHYTYYIDVTADEKILWSRLNDNCKKEIKKFSDRNLKIKKIDATRDKNSVEKFYEILKERLIEEGGGLNFFQHDNLQYLNDIIEAFPENMEMYFLYDGEEVVAVELVCINKENFVIWMGCGRSSDRASLNSILIWETMKMAKARGFKEIENWGADLKRLNMYKAKFNPSLDCCYIIKKQNFLGKIASMTMKSLVNTPIIKNVVKYVR
jgi:hypothetical protein